MNAWLQSTRAFSTTLLRNCTRARRVNLYLFYTDRSSSRNLMKKDSRGFQKFSLSLSLSLSLFVERSTSQQTCQRRSSGVEPAEDEETEGANRGSKRTAEADYSPSYAGVALLCNRALSLRPTWSNPECCPRKIRMRRKDSAADCAKDATWSGTVNCSSVHPPR